ncbi:RloB family protein [Succinivibrio dextrinosolvens]|uniref:RloB family protein n=1 Tax=Succinivibrio dextrinosolvens TaxID=83771 RepID=UPI0004E20F12|nr:RloB family protein [Succinivibrio dextrinosolvens]
MPKKIGTDNWRKKRRQEYLELKQERYYIFCEGEKTEPLYFEGFKQLIEDNPIYKNMVLIEIEPCGAETMRVLSQAEKYVRDNRISKGQIWCVYDKDNFPAQDFNKVVHRTEALNKQGAPVTYHAAWSNECIELWFLLHFADYTSNNSRAVYIEFLNKKFMELGSGKYQKNNTQTFNILMEYGNPKLAARYARRIINENEGQNPADIAPGTKVYELVEELAKYLPEEKKKLFI